MDDHIAKKYIEEFKKHYRYSPTNLGKIERIENYTTNLEEEIIKLKSQNKLLSAENSYYKHIINELEKWIRWKILHCVDYECFPEETLDKLKELKEGK